MSYHVQVAIDATDAHTLADWWAETLGWTVEEQDEAFVRRMLDEGHASAEDTTTHRGRLVFNDAAVNPDEPGRPRLYFQRVPEPKQGKNRLHLDVRVGDDDLETVVQRLADRGATRLYAERQGPHHWVTMTDPEGNEFCVSPG